MKKHFILLNLFLVTLLLGCTNVAIQKNVFDKEDEIIKQGDSYSYYSRLGTVSENTANLNFKNFYGAETIFTIEDVEILNIEISYEVSKGRFKVVLIDPNDEITIINESIVINLLEGMYRIKIVGDDATGNIDMTISSS